MLAGFHPSVRSWFEARYGTPTEPQALGWPCIQRGEDTLIAAPTGSGKTLAAFLACLDTMIHAGGAAAAAGGPRDSRGGAHGRHAPGGAPGDAAEAPARAGHDA